jgi:hypothetical protein
MIFHSWHSSISEIYWRPRESAMCGSSLRKSHSTIGCTIYIDTRRVLALFRRAFYGEIGTNEGDTVHNNAK